MSFRDTFTRNDSGSENLQYDDVAAYHFYITILVLLFVPLVYSIIKSIMNPFSHIPHLKQVEQRPQFRERISRFKKQYKYNYVTKWFIFKVVITLFICFGMYRCFIVLQETGDQMKGFDPYQILQVEPDATIQKIKKSYRKLALKYHPDRNKDDPQASARFIMISKAYQCLTNEQAKENCLKYGNPQGSTSFNVGIALPSFLVKKQNQVVIMGILFLLMVIVCPIVVIYYQSQINKYDEHGMLLENHPNLHAFINQQFSIRDCIKALPICLEFKGSLPSSNQQAYDQLMKKASEDIKNFIIKKRFLGFINKAMLLMDARLNQQPIPEHLTADQKKVLKIVPVLVRGMVMLALTRSSQEFKAIYRGQNFAGANCIESIIKFGQFFIQGKSLESQPFEQLDLLPDEIDKIYKKKKNKKIANLNSLVHNAQDRDHFISLLAPQRVSYIKNCLQYFPKIEMEVVVHTVGDKQLTKFDLVQVMIELNSQRIGSFCSAVSYPFLKQQGWYILACDNNTVLFMEYFNFDKVHQEFKFKRRPHDKVGEYSIQIKLFSDCYFGLDIERTVKYKVIEGQKIEQQTKDHEEDSDNDTMFSKMMSTLIPKQQEELSDKQDKQD